MTEFFCGVVGDFFLGRESRDKYSLTVFFNSVRADKYWKLGCVDAYSIYHILICSTHVYEERMGTVQNLQYCMPGKHM